MDHMTTNSSLPSLIEPHPLKAETIDSFRVNGWTMVRSLASAEEVGAYRVLIKASTDEFAKSYKPLEERDTYGKAFIQHINLWERDEEIRNFSLSKRFAKVAADLMGVESVRMYHDQALFKEPKGGRTPYHQDQQYWPLDGVKAVTLWMPLVNVAAEMGTLDFANESQKLGYLGPLAISDESDNRLDNLILENAFVVENAGAMRAGDATFHDGWTIHGAPGNASQSVTREVMTIIYIDASAVITEPDSPFRVNDLAAWLPGLKPGDVAASRLNPVLYP